MNRAIAGRRALLALLPLVALITPRVAAAQMPAEPQSPTVTPVAGNDGSPAYPSGGASAPGTSAPHTGYAHPPPGYAAPGYPPPAYYPSGYYYPPPPPPPAPPPPGTHVHDGFYLRFHLGVGYLRIAATSGGYSAELSGTGLHGNFALGGAVVRNFILFAALSGWSQSSSGGGTLQVSGTGGGAAYYLEALNAFVSFTVARAVIEVVDGGRRATASRPGVTFECRVGKEWWVSPNWGLGVGGAVMFGRIGVQGDPNASWSVAGGGLLFSATFN